MSPRAAWRLESLGFTDVYDYVGGLADWLAFGLTTEGREASPPRAGDAVRRDMPTCRLDDDLTSAAERIREAGWDSCVVVDDARVVLGRLRASAIGDDRGRSIEEAMDVGPTTVRPSEPLEGLIDRMRHHGVASMIVTTPDGRLVGVLRRDDAEQSFATSRE